MLVYRICKELEIRKIFENDSLNDIGKAFINNKKINNHNYEPNKKYLHFFKEYSSVFYLNTESGYYICTFDIPEFILENNAGEGYYLDITNWRNKEKVTEYAIKTEELDFNYLIKIDKITEYIDYEDYLYNEYTDKLETIYSNITVNQSVEKPKVLQKKGKY